MKRFVKIQQTTLSRRTDNTLAHSLIPGEFANSLDTNRTSIQISRWILFAALLLLGFWTLNSALLFVRLSHGPPGPDRDGYAGLSVRFFLYTLSSFALAGLTLWLLRKRPFNRSNAGERERSKDD